MKKLRLVLILIGLVSTFLFYYINYMKTEPKAINIPKEERFFEDDGTSLDWLEEPIEPVEQTDQQAKAARMAQDRQGKQETEDQDLQQEPSSTFANTQVSSSGTDSGKNVYKTDEQKMQDIKQKYTVTFKKLERSYQVKLKALIGQAKKEYIAMKKGELETTTMSLASKYMGKVKSMESEADDQFYSVLSQMEEELKGQGLPTNLIESAEEEYELRKSNQRAAFIRKFSDKL